MDAGLLTRDDISEEEPAFEEVDDDEDSGGSEPESMQTVLDDVDLEDFTIKSIVAHSIERGYLHLLVELESGEYLPVPFNDVKKDHPTEVAKYIVAHDAGRKHKTWAQSILKTSEKYGRAPAQFSDTYHQFIKVHMLNLYSYQLRNT